MFKRKGGGVKGLLNNVKKKLHFSLMMASLKEIPKHKKKKDHPSLCLPSEFFHLQEEVVHGKERSLEQLPKLQL